MAVQLANGKNRPDYLRVYDSYSSSYIRRELFKLFYLQNTFNLNEMADAAEAYTHMLELLHANSINS